MRHTRRRLTWRGTAFLVGAFAAACTLVNVVPHGTILERPFVVEGPVGETLDLSYAELTVTEVRTADTLESSFEQAVAGGTFLVVDATWRATDGYIVFAGAEVIDAEGRSFWATSRGGCAKGTNSQPGYAWRATYCFDVPRDALAGATLRLARGTHGEDDAGQRRDAVAVVDLGIGQHDVNELWDATEKISIEMPGFASAPATDAGGEG
ncbi:DUF4352 domain-containing protein [Antribacter sp. KLBMP9083]|uniref:DUF4352 domain-containing protein n=1 Tax=Antribacter soli TaxID=2910976 RepID=A0AA41QGG1_9MICO|nr:DUF4352 domain-containing protein [Antribacter soli]MCF4122663.1 DUF4352 domain-containing protein [Antribacter soli]